LGDFLAETQSEPGPCLTPPPPTPALSPAYTKEQEEQYAAAKAKVIAQLNLLRGPTGVKRYFYLRSFVPSAILSTRPVVNPEELREARKRLKAVEKKSSDVYDGHVLTDEELYGVSRRLRPDSCLHSFGFLGCCPPTQGVRYVQGEHRCVTDRNVTMLAGKLKLIDVQYVREKICWPGVVRGLARLSLRLFLVSIVVALSHGLNSRILPARSVFGADLVVLVWASVASYLSEWLGYRLYKLIPGDWIDVDIVGLTYAPHMLTTALREYRPGDAGAVDASVDQKVLRQGALPLPDVEALEVQTGTVYVCRYLSDRLLFQKRPQRPCLGAERLL